MAEKQKTEEETQDNVKRADIGELDPSLWDEARAVTGRPNDTPLPNTTFVERFKARSSTTKAVQGDQAENKAVRSASTKRK